MKIETTVKEVGGKEDYYEVKIKTYKQTLEGTFERSELRHHIEQLDNAINVGCSNEEVPINPVTNNTVV